MSTLHPKILTISTRQLCAHPPHWLNHFKNRFQIDNIDFLRQQYNKDKYCRASLSLNFQEEIGNHNCMIDVDCQGDIEKFYFEIQKICSREMGTNTSKSLASNELIPIVNKSNKILGLSYRSDMRREFLRHRATYVFLKIGDKFVIQKRSSIKDYMPSHYDICPGGVVSITDYSEDENVHRELCEEMGENTRVRNCRFLGCHLIEIENVVNVYGYVYIVHLDNEIEDFKLQVEEVESVHLWTVEEIESVVDQMCPDSLYLFKKFKEFLC